jgi:hypothetical protein
MHLPRLLALTTAIAAAVGASGLHAAPSHPSLSRAGAGVGKGARCVQSAKPRRHARRAPSHPKVRARTTSPKRPTPVAKTPAIPVAPAVAVAAPRRSSPAPPVAAPAPDAVLDDTGLGSLDTSSLGSPVDESPRGGS